MTGVFHWKIFATVFVRFIAGVRHWSVNICIFGSYIMREKGRDLTQSYDKSPYTHRNSKKQSDNTKTPPNTYTTIEDRLRMVIFSNDSHSTGVVKPVLWDPRLPTYRKRCVIKRTCIYKCVNNPPYKEVFIILLIRNSMGS